MALTKLGFTAALLLAGAQVVQAADDLQINGFINVTGGVLDSKDIIDSPAAPGYDTTLGFDSQTLAGLQVAKKVNDSTSATVQLMSRGATGYNTTAAWAYLTFEPTDGSAFRFGRLRTPFFQYSDFLDVGYAYNWMSPPGIVYRLDSMANLTGVDFTQKFTFGAMDGSVQAYTGRYKNDFILDGDTYEMELRGASGLLLSINSGDFGARAGYHQADFYINGLSATGGRALDKLVVLANAFGITQDVIPEGQKSAFMQGSVYWDNGSTSLVFEYTALRHDSYLLNDDDAWFVSLAQRLGSFTPHLTYAYVEDKLKSGTIGLAQKAAEAKDSSVTLGLRYDYNSSVALKTDISYITAEKSTDRLKYVAKEGAAAMNRALVTETGMLYSIGMSIVF